MKRRRFLATIPAAIGAGCVGSGDESEVESTQADDGFEPNGVVLEWGKTAVMDGPLAVEAVDEPYYTDSLTYYDDDGDEQVHDPVDKGYLGVMFDFENRGGSEIEFPGFEGFTAVGGDELGGILEEPADGITWDQVDDLSIEEKQAGAFNPDAIDPHSTLMTVFTLLAPLGTEYVRWEHDYEIDGENQPVFWKL